MKSDFTLAFNEILESRALSKEVVIEALEQALISAYRRDASVTSSQQRIQAQITPDGQPRILLEKEVVEDIIDDRTEVMIGDAHRYYPDSKLGDMVMMPVEHHTRDFGRIAAQTAKQVILQRIREAERDTLYTEFIEREGDLVTGTVQGISGGNVTLSLGRAEAVMPRAHQIPNERYRQHDKIRTFVVEVSRSTKGPQIIVSRAHKDMLRRLLEYEVPEIYNGIVEIKSIAREAGHRSKVAVTATQDSIDPVGACVGMRGMRIQNIIKELNNEKIDVIEWDPDPAKYISKALSPARVSGVYLDNEIDQVRTAVVIVPDDALSLAIGREGQNARLAAKLTGWRIDIKNVTEAALENFNNLIQPPLDTLITAYPDLITEVGRILEKKQNNRPVMPEEYTTLTKFVDYAERAKLRQLVDERIERETRFESVRPLIPPRAFDLPLSVLELADDIMKALNRIENVGELMVRVLADEEHLVQTLRQNKAADDAMDAIRYALDDLVIPEILEEEAQDETAEEVETPVIETPRVATPEPVASIVDSVIPPLEEAVLETEDAPPAFPEISQPKPTEPPKAVEEDVDFAEEISKSKKRKLPFDTEVEETDQEDTEDTSKQSKKKKGKNKRVELIYDEDAGEMVAKRRRKGSRSRDEFDEFDV